MILAINQVANGRFAHFLHPDLKNQLGLVQKAHSFATDKSQLMVGASKSHTSRPAEPDTSDKSLGANALSLTADKDFITKSLNKAKTRRKK